MLRNFAASQADTVAATRTALLADDLATASRLVHTLKGLAGNIAAAELQAAAGAVERVLQVGGVGRNAALETLDLCLAQQVAAINAALPVVAPVGTKPAVDLQRLDTVCQQLSVLLAADDGDAESVLNQNAGLLAAAFPQNFAQLQEAVNQFDAPRGLALLKVAMATSKVGK